MIAPRDGDGRRYLLVPPFEYLALHEIAVPARATACADCRRVVGEGEEYYYQRTWPIEGRVTPCARRKQLVDYEVVCLVCAQFALARTDRVQA